MAALSEDGSYGLDCGHQDAGRVTVLHVKLTETALRAIESQQKRRVSRGAAGVGAVRSRHTARLPRTGKGDQVRRRRVSVPGFQGEAARRGRVGGPGLRT